MATGIDSSMMYCIIGAGASGIAAGRALKDAGIPFEIIEREDEVGGNWYYGKPFSRVYNSTHLISSRRMTAYLDYPMPRDYPDYPDHRQVLAYLRDAARHFGLYDHMRFNTTVEQVTRTDDGLWDVVLSNSHGRRKTTRYGGLVIANGHLWNPRYPRFPGEFHGQIVHAADYKTPDILRGKRVLVVGAGNSGCDIAVESAQNALETYHSTRRGYWYMPKFAFGIPGDLIYELSLRSEIPGWLRRTLMAWMLRVIVGDQTRFGLKKPDHKLFASHPIINQQLTYYLGHGKIDPKPDVAHLYGDAVQFTDGSEAQIDLIVYATGYNLSFPFIDKALLDWDGGKPDLYLNAYHRRFDNLFVIGLLESDSGLFWLADYQSRVMAAFIRAAMNESPAAQAFRRLKANARPDLGGGLRYLPTNRHSVEIAHHPYRKMLRSLLKELNADTISSA